MPLVQFARQSRPGIDAAAYSGERLINYFAQSADGTSPVVLLCRGGLTQTARPKDAQTRAMTKMGGVLYSVIGGTVWKIEGATATDVGTVPDKPARIASSKNEIAIVTDGKYYICDGTDTTEYSTGAIDVPVDVEALDGYFIVIGESAGRGDGITVSGLDDGTTFDSLDFAFAEDSPDDLVAIKRFSDQLMMFGTDTVQVFYNSGAADFPFAPVSGQLIEHGCLGETVAYADNAVFWVRPDGTVLRSGGSDPQVISPPEIKEALAKGAPGQGMAWSERGHEFYAVARDGGTTLVYDLTTGLWHERSSGLAYGPWAATHCQELSGETYFGTSDGRVATASDDTFTDFGDVLMAEGVSLPIQQGADRFRISKLHMNFTGGQTDIGRTPQVMLQTSKDGVTWGSEHWRDLPKPGDHYPRVTWHRLGQYRRAQAKIRITDPVQRDIIGVEVTYG